jgi:hypothetical protein
MRTTDLFKNNRSSKRLNESLAKTFGTTLDLESFDTPKLEDARNKLRTQIHTARQESGFNETIENETLTKAQFMHDAIVAELMDRQEHIVDTSVQEGADIDRQQLMAILKRFDENMNEIGGYGDPDYNKILTALNQGDVESAVEEVWYSYYDQDGGEIDMDAYIEDLEAEFKDMVGGNESAQTESVMSEIAIELAQVADDEDYDKLYDLLSDPGPVGQYLQDKIDEITGETGLHPKDDIEKIEPMLMDIVQQEFGGQNDDEGGETDDNYALASAGFGSDEDYESIEMERVRDPEEWDEGNTEPPNNFAVSINGKQWKVFKGRGQYADDDREKQHYRQLKDWAAKKSESTGKKWTVSITGENPTESIDQKEDMNTNEAYINNARDAINLLADIRKQSKMAELGQGDPVRPNQLVNDLYDVMQWIEANMKESVNTESVNTGDIMTRLQEGEVQQASAIVTAKTMVDRVSRWIEELSSMENDTLLQLGDSIRDEMGQDQAKGFISSVAPAIQQALENLKSTRETMATGVRQLTGEEQGAEMLGGEPAGMGGDEMGPAEPDAMNMGDEMGDMGGEDEFAAAEPAAGGLGDAGREQRESINRSSSLLKVLAG